MRLLMHALVGLMAACCTTITQAELQWQATSVRQASHAASPAPTKRAGRPKAIAKAPSVVRREEPQAVQQAAAAEPARVASRQIDTAVQPACAQCGCGHQGCECGQPYYEGDACPIEPGCGCGDPSCGIVEPGCGVEPSCGLTYGEACGCGDIGCGGACGDGIGCGDAVGVPLMLYLPPLRELTFDVGVQAFKNALDDNRDRGNFGVNYGVNAGGKMTWLGLQGLGYQVGARGVSSQLHGDATAGTSDAHTQTFITAGLFHRKAVGLQYGLVYDVLRDERQMAQDFSQIRGLISVTNPRGHEIGFQFAKHLSDAQINGTTYHAIDQYLAFYRMHGCQGGEFRVFGGFDDDSKGILGADFSIPLTDRWGLDTGFTYVIPEEDANGVGATQEAWNLGMNLVWHYGHRARKSFKGQYRPMFRVADNGLLIVDDRLP